MSGGWVSSDERFAAVFDRMVTACARADVLVRQSAAAAARAREERAVSQRRRALALAARDYWASADLVLTSMRREVDVVAARLRDEGMEREDAAAIVRARVRFVLYDGGFREAEAESVVHRASTWVEELFEAA